MSDFTKHDFAIWARIEGDLLMDRLRAIDERTFQKLEALKHSGIQVEGTFQRALNSMYSVLWVEHGEAKEDFAHKDPDVGDLQAKLRMMEHCEVMIDALIARMDDRRTQ